MPLAAPVMIATRPAIERERVERGHWPSGTAVRLNARSFARMQPVAFVAKARHRDDADLQVRGDGFLVELVGLSRQL